VGEKEESEGTVAVRRQGEGDKGSFSLQDFKDMIWKEMTRQTEGLDS
jgi:threonyl-tRNA synthetase